MENKNIFIGREKELEILHEAYKETSIGKGKLVLISGNTGLGKSALIKTFLSQISRDEKVISAFSACTDMEDHNPYSPIKNAFIELNAKNFNKKITIDKLKEIVAEAGPSWIGMLPVIGNSLSTGITTFQSIKKTFFKNDDKPIIENKDDVFRIFETELRRLAEKKTLVICIDDLQWADTSSLNVFYELGMKIRNKPFKILLIGTYRPNDIEIGRKKDTEEGLISVRHPFANKLNEFRNYTKKDIHETVNPNWLIELNLTAFNKIEFEEYINTLFPNNNFNTIFFTDIYDFTDGDPLFVTEIIDHLHQNNSIELIDGIYSAKQLHIDSLPKSVSASIAQKVDRLNEVLKDILTYASVNGETFMVDIIEQILDLNRFKLLKHLKNLDKIHNLLIEEDSVKVNGKEFNRYQFSRSLVQKYIYKTLLSSAEKKELHQFISETFLSIYGEEEINNNQSIRDKYLLHKQIGSGLINSDDFSINSFSDKHINENMPKASEFIDAAKVSLQKAKESYEQFAMDECNDFVDKTLAFLSKIEDSNTEKMLLRFDALMRRNKSLDWQGHYQQAFDSADEACNIAIQIENEKKIAQANLALGIAKSSLGYSKDALSYFDKSIAYYQTTDNHSSLWKAYYEAGITNNAMAAYDNAINLLKKALLLSNKIKDKNIKGRTLLILGRCYSAKLVGFSKAMSYFNQALTIFEETNNQYLIGDALNKIGLEYMGAARGTEALEFFEKALNIAHKQNDRVHIANRCSNIAATYEGLSNYEKAIEYYEKSLIIDKVLDDIPSIAHSMNCIGGAYAKKGEFEKAMDYLYKSLDIKKTINNPKELSISYYTLASAYETMNKDDKAVEYYLKAIEIDASINDRAGLALNNYFLGNFYYNKTKYELATKYHLNALELFTEIGNDLFIAITNNSLGLITHNEEKYNEAIVYYKKSLNYYIEIDDKSNQSDLLENLAKSYHNIEQYDKAIDYYTKAIKIAEIISEETHLSRQYSGIGNTYYWLEKYEKSIQFYLKSIKINLHLNGNNSSQVSDDYENIGLSYFWAGNYNSAIENHQKALTIRTKIFGDESNVTNSSVFNLAQSYYLADQDKKARELFYRALKYREKNYGIDSEEYNKVKEYIEKIDTILSSEAPHGSAAPEQKQTTKNNTVEASENSIIKDIETHFNTGLKHFNNSEYNEAMRAYQNALKATESLPENDILNKSRADIYFQIGQTCKKARDYDNAIVYFINAYNKYIKLTEQNKSDLGMVCVFLGDIYYYKNDYKKAIENHKEALQFFLSEEPTNDYILGFTYYNLGDDYYWNKQQDEAIVYYRKALKIKVLLNGEEHREVAICYVQIGKSYFEINDKLSAISNLKTAYSINKNLYGTKSRETDEVQLILGQAYKFSERDKEAKEYLYASLEFRKEFFGEDSEEYSFVKKWIEENGVQ